MKSKNKISHNAKTILFIFSIAIILSLFSQLSKSATVTSTTYIVVETIAAGGSNVSSSSYKVDFSIGQIAIGITNSSTYNVSLGRYYTETVIKYVITFTLSKSTAWWEENITASGSVTLAGGSPVTGATMTIRKDNAELCSANTTASGSYSCTFLAPNELGTYTIVAQIPGPDGRLLTVSVPLTVEAEYGDKPIGTTERSVFEIPVVIQEPSGKISTPFARITIWKR